MLYPALFPFPLWDLRIYLSDSSPKIQWVSSESKSDYGKFRLTAGKIYGDRDREKGLQTTENSKFYAISSRFKSFSNKGRSLVIQYTVKHEQKIDCGGGYIKVFPFNLRQKNMSGESQYYIMFGPDICGSETKKVHVILNYKNKLNSMKKQIRCKVDGFTHLYTLILRPDQTYEVKIDNEQVESGSLEDDWDFLPPRTINDPTDWDEPEHILDNSAEKPEDWDDLILFMDSFLNSTVLWLTAFRTCGIWPHPQIENPSYSPDFNIYSYDNISVIGLDLWQVRSGTIFDNFLITDNEEYAEEFGDDTWGETKLGNCVSSSETLGPASDEKERELGIISILMVLHSE
uniref:Calreticulin 3 n=1 Tax=Sphenodon punctatus TaxID=8508 RepID=A0A8D0GXN3_SPHPU